jgi:hypothetical protein
VVDEWQSAEDFQQFFAEATEIPGLMAEVGVRSEPEIVFWRKLDTHDEVAPRQAASTRPRLTRRGV